MESIVKKEISNVYFGYLIGRTRETLEASIADERQLRALTSVLCDRMYDWWRGADGNDTLPTPPTTNIE